MSILRFYGAETLCVWEYWHGKFPLETVVEVHKTEQVSRFPFNRVWIGVARKWWGARTPASTGLGVEENLHIAILYSPSRHSQQPFPLKQTLGPLFWLNFQRGRMNRLPGCWVFHQRSPQSWNEVIACHPGYEAWPKRLLARVKEISLKFPIKIHVHLHSTLRYVPVYFNAHLPLKS